MQTLEEQTTLQVGQDTIQLISHQLISSVTKLQIVYDMWDDKDARLEQLQAESLHILHHEIKFLQRLGKYILQLDPATGAKLQVDLIPLDLVDLVRQTVSSFQSQERERHFAESYGPDLPLVWGDAERLQDVLDNLLSNALKYSPSGSPVNISVQRNSNDQARVSVTNFGSYIPPGERARVFAKFYRGKGHQHGGFGLGLYLAQRLVEQHGGRIWVESWPATETTTFHFTLLLADHDQSTAPDDSWEQSPVLDAQPQPALG